MSYTQTTEFYGIPLPQETDLVNPMDDNDAKERIDTDLHSAVQNASSAVETANSASDAAAAATSSLEELSGIVNTEKGKLTALTARVTAAENEISDVRSDSNDMICAFNEPTATSTHAYAIGDYFIYNNVLYKATSAIAISDTIVPNTNCAATNVTTEIDAINTALSVKKVTITADGVKTLSTLLAELASAISGLTINKELTKLIISSSVFDYSSTEDTYTNISVTSTNVVTTLVKVDASPVTRRATIASGSVTFDDISSTVLTNGTKVELIYTIA